MFSLNKHFSGSSLNKLIPTKHSGFIIHSFQCHSPLNCYKRPILTAVFLLKTRWCGLSNSNSICAYINGVDAQFFPVIVFSELSI